MGTDVFLLLLGLAWVAYAAWNWRRLGWRRGRLWGLLCGSFLLIGGVIDIADGNAGKPPAVVPTATTASSAPAPAKAPVKPPAPRTHEANSSASSSTNDALKTQVLQWKACPAEKDDIQTTAAAVVVALGDEPLGSAVGSVDSHTAIISLFYSESGKTKWMNFALDRQSGQVIGTDQGSKLVVSTLEQMC